MKSSTLTLAMTFALSSSSSISSMPHSRASAPHTLLFARSTTHMVRGSPLQGQLINYAQAGLYKRRSESEHKKSNVKSSQKDDTDNDDDCEESVDSNAAEHPGDAVDQTQSKIGSNTTGGAPPSNSLRSSSKYGLPPRRPAAPETSKRASESSSEWPSSSVQSAKVTKDEHTSHKHAAPSERHHRGAYGSGANSKYHGGMDGGYHGKATFFSQAGTPGACGKTHQDSDYVVAIQSSMYDGGKFCGKTVLVTRKSTGQSIKCIAADACPGCPTQQSLDLSIGAFKALGTPDEGVFDIKWEVLD